LNLINPIELLYTFVNEITRKAISSLLTKFNKNHLIHISQPHWS